MTDSYLTRLPRIETLIFDVDGVMTDGSVILLPSGDQVRTMNVKDGFALQAAMKLGYRIAIISGGKSEAVRERFKYLGLTDIYLGASDKIEVFDEYCLTWDLDPETIMYMGDDLPDYPVMQRVGLAACPADAAPEIIGVSHYVSSVDGGQGCVRDILEKVMRAQGKWFDQEVHAKNLEAFRW